MSGKEPGKMLQCVSFPHVSTWQNSMKAMTGCPWLERHKGLCGTRGNATGLGLHGAQTGLQVPGKGTVIL